MAAVWTPNINHTIGNAMIRDAKLKQMQRVTLSGGAEARIICTEEAAHTEPLTLVQNPAVILTEP